MAFRLELFGTCALRSAPGAALARAAQPRQLALLAVLGASPDGAARRPRLASLLCPEATTAQARRLISDAAYIIRAELGQDALVAHRDELRLNPVVIACDVQELLAARGEARWEDMVRLYRGPFLDGFDGIGSWAFDDWSEAERIRCREEVAAAVWKLVERCEREGAVADAVAWLRRGQAVDPDDELFSRRLMDLLDRTGNRAAAVRTFHELRRRLARSLGLEPSPESQALADRILAR